MNASASASPATALARVAAASLVALLLAAAPDVLAATDPQQAESLVEAPPGNMMNDMSWALVCIASFMLGQSVVRAGGRWAFTEETEWIDEMILQTQGGAVVYALTATGVMDELPNPGEPGLSASELARRCGIVGSGKANVLGRLLRVLVALDVVEEQHRHGDAGGSLFRHGERSRHLRRDAGSHVRTLASVHLSPAQARPWWRIEEALRSPEETEPFRLESGGAGVFDFYSDPANARAARHFDDLMQLLSGSAEEAESCAGLIAALPLWAEVAAAGGAPLAGGRAAPLVVDVGGGLGHVLAAVLERHRGLRGALFDRPDVVSSSAVVPALRGELANRTSFVGGSFLSCDGTLPGDADVFVLKWILHDWSDEKCRDVLRSIRSAMRAADSCGDGEARTARRPRLLLVEQVLPEDTDRSEMAEMSRRQLKDAGMWIVYGGRERKVSEYSALLESEGFATERVTELSGFQLIAIEAVPIPDSFEPLPPLTPARERSTPVAVMR